MNDKVMMASAEWWAKSILDWYQQNGRHQLPWQNPITPYRCWVSEVMLQQTQVSTVIPYFLNFMQRFPEVEPLAEASLDEVLSLWSGLGYYSRARSLHKAAIAIQAQGGFPDTAEGWVALPGIGQSTAHAILAQAYGIPAPILDGNVKRVLSRFHALDIPLTETKAHQALWAIAEEYLPPHSSQAYAQAMMDLGALVCTRSQPKCTICPIHTHCQAYQTATVNQYPRKSIKRPKPRRKTQFSLLIVDQEIGLIKRPARGIWGGLWCLPEIEDLSVFKNECATISQLGPFEHTFTHFHLDYFVNRVILAKKPSISEITWTMPEEALYWGLPSPIRKTLEAHLTKGGW